MPIPDAADLTGTMPGTRIGAPLTVAGIAQPLAKVTLSTHGTTSALGVGGHGITAVYGGDVNNGASTSAALNQTVNKAATTTSVGAPVSGMVGQPAQAMATGAVTAPGAGTPSGAIAVSTSNGAAGCTITLPAMMRSLTPTGSGPQTLTASYAENANFSPSSGMQPITIGGQAQTISFTSTPPASATVGGTYAVGATATSSLAVGFAIDPTSTAGACTIGGATVTFSGQGTGLIAASQATGNGTFVAAAPKVTQSTGVAFAPATPVPTLGEWLLMLLAVVLGGLGSRQRQRLA